MLLKAHVPVFVKIRRPPGCSPLPRRKRIVTCAPLSVSFVFNRGDGGVKCCTVACQGAAPDALVKVFLRDDLPTALGKLQQ